MKHVSNQPSFIEQVVVRVVVAAIVILIIFALGSCNQSAPPAAPEGPTVGDIPIAAGATPLEALPNSLTYITQVHSETVEQPVVDHFLIERPFLDVVDEYDSIMREQGWTLIDSLNFGDGGNLRRYHRDQQRAILAFEPEGEEQTLFMLMEGTVQ